MPSHRTMIVSDVHLRWRQVEEMLSWERYDKLILTGDIWDSARDDTAENNADAARWIKAKLEDPRTVVCVGNHDMQHLWPDNPWVRFDDTVHGPAAKHMAVDRVLTDDDRHRFVPCHVDQGILFSHAGFDLELPQQLAAAGCEAPTGALTVDGIAAFVNHIWPEVCARYARGSVHPLMEAGKCRSGLQRIGGLCWRSFDSLKPVPGVGQIVGHTVCERAPLMRIVNRGGAPMWRFIDKRAGGINPRWLINGWALCMDTFNKHYAILENDTITVKRVHWHQHRRLDERGEVRAVSHHDDPWRVEQTASSEDIVIHLKEPTHV